MSRKIVKCSEIYDQLEKCGEKNTPVRRLIISILCAAKSPLSANEILNQIKNKNLKVHRSTIYRDLDLLVKCGLVVSYSFKTKNVLYYEIKSEHHHHIVCENCEIVKIIYPKKIELAIKEYEKNLFEYLGFKTISHRLKFYGLCNKCNKNKEI